MELRRLLRELEQHGATLRAEGDTLYIRPVGVGAAFRAAIAAHKAALLDLARNQHDGRRPNDAQLAEAIARTAARGIEALPDRCRCRREVYRYSPAGEALCERHAVVLAPLPPETAEPIAIVAGPACDRVPGTCDQCGDGIGNHQYVALGQWLCAACWFRIWRRPLRVEGEALAKDPAEREAEREERRWKTRVTRHGEGH